ncbi:YceI family protein [Bacteroidota bacterium]
MRVLQFIFLGLVMSALQVEAQQIFVSDSSRVVFYSHTPIEDIEAYNEAGTSILNIAKSEATFRVPIRGFQFAHALMQEHFNENYMDSEKFPHATFKGKLSDLLNVTIDTLYHVAATGLMNIHGVDYAAPYTGTLETRGDTIFINSEFSVFLSHHNIKVPRVVFSNIAEEIKVKIFFRYVPYKE